MGMTLCPKCGKPMVPLKTRIHEEHVSRVDSDPRRLRRVSNRLWVCPVPAGCGRRWLFPWVELEPVETQLRSLPPAFSPYRDQKRVTRR